MFDVLPELIVFAISAAFTPGPNNIMIMTSGVNFGARASMPHFFGICFGFPTMFLATGFGLGALFINYPSLHMIVKVFGLVYLSYLAWQIATAGKVERGERMGEPFTFVQAALFQWVNPKAWIMGTSAIAAFTVVGHDLVPQILLIAVVFFSMTFPSAGVWLAFGSSLKRLFENGVYLRAFNIVMAVLLLWSMRHAFVQVFGYFW
jgi:threonine/homoserine/homoserine lactone efflux protein